MRIDKRKRKVILFWAILLVLSGVFLASCAQSTTTISVKESIVKEDMGGETESATMVMDESEESTETPSHEELTEAVTETQPEVMDVEPASEAENEATPELPMEKPAVKQGLAASDPEAVVLASGRLQLVEFFAYW
jgi:pyruvate/2-oxoglutarate dehydrogenase complex dihydrolipoamide acyltransferase (E2) component